MKILHVIPSVSGKHGGPSYAIYSFAKASKQAGIEVVIATTDDDGNHARLNVPLNTAVNVNGVTHFFFSRDLVFYKVSFALRGWLNRHVAQFDVVHIHALFSFSSVVAARAAKKHGVPYIIRPLGVLNRWGIENRRPMLKRLSLRLIELPILRGAAGIHFTSETERREAANVGAERTTFLSFVIPIPVEPKGNKGDKNNFVRKFPAVTGKKLILFLSRVDRKKGVDLLLEAFAAVKNTDPECLLVIAGEGDRRYTDCLRAQAKQLGVAEDIIWTGFLGPEDKWSAYAAASVFVLPSHSENFGIAAAEALAAGVPCILSDRVALVDYLQNNDPALVVPCQSAAIASALHDLLSKPELCARLGDRGRHVAAEYFSLETVGKALSELYRSILHPLAVES